MDSTRKIYLNGLVASLASLAILTVCGMLVARLSIGYLDRSGFGLLSLITQVSTYIGLVDLGLQLSFSRILIDFTTGDRAGYANVLKTASRVFNLLGFVGFALACAIAWVGADALSIPPELRSDFRWLMSAQGAALWIWFAMKPLTAPLTAHGKHHVIYWLSSATALVNALVFWLALKSGVGIYSGLAGQAAQIAVHVPWLWKLALSYRTHDGASGQFDRGILKEVAAFSRDSMLWQIGGQTLTSLPVFLAASWFALGGIADLSAGMKVIVLLVSVCTRFGDMSVTPLSMQFASGNEAAAANKLTRIAGLAGAMGCCGAIAISFANPAFLSWWMLGKTVWPWHANLAGALWVAVLAVTQCIAGYAVVCRQMHLIRWAQLVECAVYVLLALWFRQMAGFASLLWAKPVACLLVGVVVAIRLGKHTLFMPRHLIPGLCRQLLVLAIVLPAGPFWCDWLGDHVASPLLAFLIAGVFASVIMVAALPLLLTRAMRADLSSAFAGITRHPLLRRAKPGPSST